MENQQEAMNMMMMMIKRMQEEQHTMSEMKSAVVRLVQRNGEFDGKDVSRYLCEYKAEMMRCGIPEGLQVTSFNRVVTDELQERIHKIGQQNPTWESFEEALREAYDFKRSKGQDRREFDEWVASEKTYRSATQVFLEFEHHFAQLSKREQRLVGMDKVLLFVKSIDRRKRMTIGVKLEEDGGANGLTEDWTKVERVCQRCDKREIGISSATTQLIRDGRRGMRCANTLPPKEENSMKYDNTQHGGLDKGGIQRA